MHGHLYHKRSFRQTFLNGGIFFRRLLSLSFYFKKLPPAFPLRTI